MFAPILLPPFPPICLGAIHAAGRPTAAGPPAACGIHPADPAPMSHGAWPPFVDPCVQLATIGGLYAGIQFWYCACPWFGVHGQPPFCQSIVSPDCPFVVPQDPPGGPAPRICQPVSIASPLCMVLDLAVLLRRILLRPVSTRYSLFDTRVTG